MLKFKPIPSEKLAEHCSPLRAAQDKYNELLRSQQAHIEQMEKSRASAEGYEQHILEWRDAARKLSR